MIRLSTFDFCESCLKIRCGNSSITVKEMLNSPGYAHPLGPVEINYTILFSLQDKGGCSNCINMVKSATTG